MSDTYGKLLVPKIMKICVLTPLWFRRLLLLSKNFVNRNLHFNKSLVKKKKIVQKNSIALKFYAIKQNHVIQIFF